jgi:hypothetical protein
VVADSIALGRDRRNPDNAILAPSHLTPLDPFAHLFDTGWVARPVLNVEQPPNIPQRPMGSIPVVIRLVRPDGEEWWPGTANRWTDTHVLVHWVEDEQQAQDHHYELAWLRAEDVRRFLKT